MRHLRTMILLTGLGLALTACGSKTGDPGFQYSIDEFADIEVLRYQVPGWEDLSLQQKEYIYHLSEAAKAGRDITWDQNFKYNLEIRHVLEAILENQAIDRSAAEWNDFLVYAKRVFFSNGIHHHYANDKILPACSRSYFASLMDAVGTEPGRAEFLLQVIYDPDLYPTLQYQGTEKDLVEASAVNFYEGVTADEVNAFYTKMENPNDPHPISYGLNSKVVKEDGKVVEKTWKVGGIYGPALEVIIGHLEAAKAVAENDTQKKYIDELIAYYRSGDLRMWDQYNITWVADTE
ncbi:MAG: dihydrofolate reductase, partial [Bacteroidales bacterium]|nr:dihydrofolate reductase [Bacteroidales bacterium]